MCHAEVMKMNDNKMWALVKEKPEQGLWLKRVQTVSYTHLTLPTNREV